MTAAWAWVTLRGRDVPALPAGLRGPVAQVDVLAVEAEALVEAAQLVQHLAAQEQEGAQHPVGFDRLGRLVRRRSAARRSRTAAERRAPDDRPRDGREAAPGGLPRPVRVEERRPGDAAARPASAKSRRRATASGAASVSGFATTTNGAVVLAMPRLAFAAKPSGRSLSTRLRITTSSLDLRLERADAPLQLGALLVDDDDGRDGHTSSR